MSWEEMSTKRIKCLCGKGHISQTFYGDDWNRYEEGPLIIECDNCRRNYIVEKEYHGRMLSSDGGWTSYYFTPIGYPPYSGIKLCDVYPDKVGLYDVPFYEFLIKNYSLQDLKATYIDMETEHAASRLKGAGKSICTAHKRRYNTVRLSTIMPLVKQAISGYASYEDNKENRDIVEDKERAEYASYMAEKRKHQIRINI